MSFQERTRNPSEAAGQLGNEERWESATDDRVHIDTPEQIALEFPLAGIGSRFMGLAIDTVIQALIYIAAIFAMIGIAKYGPTLLYWFAWLPQSWAPAILIFFLFCVYWGYFAFFEAIWKGQTPGKRIAGIRAIKETGRALNVYEVIGRNLLRAVDALPTMYIAGIVSIMVTRQNQRLGDLLVGSIVVHDKGTEDIRPEWSSSAAPTAASLQLAKINPEELVLIETYLQRRHSLEPGFRDATAVQIATRITAKTGIERAPDQSLDDFLEFIAKQVRDHARYR